MCEVNTLGSSRDIYGNGGLFISEWHFTVNNGFEHHNSAVIKTSTNVTKILSMQPESR
jgi:hypothetical protein